METMYKSEPDLEMLWHFWGMNSFQKEWGKAKKMFCGLTSRIVIVFFSEMWSKTSCMFSNKLFLRDKKDLIH